MENNVDVNRQIANLASQLAHLKEEVFILKEMQIKHQEIHESVNELLKQIVSAITDGEKL
jgi:hypothetical protein